MSPPSGRALPLAATAVFAWAAALAANRSLRRVTGTSMAPRLLPGDRVAVVPVAARRLRRGDVVVVRDPRQPARQTVKRVVGLPGERVELTTDGLLVDDRAYLEPYASTLPPATTSVRPPTHGWSVPPGHLVVLGDLRTASTDSRHYGTIALANLVGRVLLRVRPPGRAPHDAPLAVEVPEAADRSQPAGS